MSSKKSNKSKSGRPKKEKKPALGKGIEALIPEFDEDELQRPDFFLCEVDRIHPNRYQPRQRFDEDDLAALARSIKAKGVLQPLLVRADTIDYELIAGERRLRAAKMAGLAHIPVLVKKAADADLLEAAIIENIQREDLNPLEEANAYHRLMSEFDLTQEQTAQRVSKSRSAVANILRLRKLPDPIKASIIDKQLSMGHARALLACGHTTQQEAVWKEIIKKGLSVRQTEALIQRLEKGNKQPQNRKADPNRIYFNGLAEGLARDLGTKVRIDRRGKKGTVSIEFYSDDDLDRLIERLRQ